jgi:hypothetical protein
MNKFVTILTAVFLTLSCTTLPVHALTGGLFNAQVPAPKASPLIEKTACGYPGHCPRGFGQRCAYGHCWCRPCY